MDDWKTFSFDEDALDRDELLLLDSELEEGEGDESKRIERGSFLALKSVPLEYRLAWLLPPPTPQPGSALHDMAL